MRGYASDKIRELSNYSFYEDKDRKRLRKSYSLPIGRIRLTINELLKASRYVGRLFTFAGMKDFREQLRSLVDHALLEDLGDGDHSTLSCISNDAKGKALLKIKQDGVLAGLEVAREIFLYKEPSSRFIAFKNDGDEIKNGEVGFEVEATIHTILKSERLLLNCMQRMSGIATLTKSYADKLKGYSTKILDTRKTTPNFRLLEKEAVRIGGGINHRFGLYDMIMLKDNHIDFCGSLERAIERAYQYVCAYKPHLKIEIEARSIEDVRKIVEVGKSKVFRIMLDNLSPSQITEAMKIIDKKAGLHNFFTH